MCVKECACACVYVFAHVNRSKGTITQTHVCACAHRLSVSWIHRWFLSQPSKRKLLYGLVISRSTSALRGFPLGFPNHVVKRRSAHACYSEQGLHPTETMATECGVCLEEFEAEGDRVPKLLPCSHTLCLRCAERLVEDPPDDDESEEEEDEEEGTRLRCPECRQRHHVPEKGPQGLTTNRYVVDFLSLPKPGAQQCGEHGRPWALFCAHVTCLKLLCSRCPIQDHVEHNLVGAFESLKDAVDLDYVRLETNVTTRLLQDHVTKVEEVKNHVISAGEQAQRDIAQALDAVFKQAEALNMAVEEKVNKAVADLEKMKEETQEKMREKSEILEAADDCPDDPAWKAYTSFTGLVEKLNAFKREACDVARVAPQAPTVWFDAKVPPIGKSLLGSVRQREPGEHAAGRSRGDSGSEDDVDAERDAEAEPDPAPEPDPDSD